MADGMSAIEVESVSETYAEYMVIQEIDGKTYGSPVYMTQGFDGIWRIDAM